MRRALIGRSVLLAGMLLAALALAGCESAEDQEIRALIDEIAAIQEQTIAAMEASAAAKDEEARERVVGDESWPAEVLANLRADVARNEEQAATRRAERLEARRRAHENLLAKLRETLASGDWETAYPEDSALLSPLEIVRFFRGSARRELREADAARDHDMAWRERRAEREERRVEREADAKARAEAMRRLPDPSAWLRG